MGRSAADITPITQGSDVSYWLRLSKREPSPDDDEDEPEGDSSTRDIARMGPVFPTATAENTVGDPNGIDTVFSRAQAGWILVLFLCEVRDLES
jgi:hypothetical protein